MMTLKSTLLFDGRRAFTGLIDLVDDRRKRSIGTEAIQVFLSLSALAAACLYVFLISLQLHTADND